MRKPLLRVMWLDVSEGYRSYDRVAQERGAVLLSQEWEAVDPAREVADVLVVSGSFFPGCDGI